MLDIRALSVAYPDGTVAVSELTLSVQPGERVALIGANGAGKTSLLLALVGVLPCTGGVEADGLALSKRTLPALRDRLGLVFQNPDDQLFMPTIFEDVAFGLQGRGLPPEEIAGRVRAQLAALGAAHLETRSPRRLSGGEKRMAALAAVLAMEPRYLLLDEPTAFLDPRARRALIRALRALPHAMLIATHDLAFAAETCARCVLLREGRVFADGPARKLLYDAALMDACGVEAIGWTEEESP